MKRCFAVVLVLASAACSGGSPSPTMPSSNAPPLAPKSETFSGTVSVGGNDSHSFAVVLSNGQLTVDLTAVGPPSTISMGVGIGQPANGVCTLFTNGFIVTQAGPTAQLSGNNVDAGTYCVMVYDAGNQVAEVTYSVTVTHY
jgi:hypothetical protein